jgi:hypothetical protein
MKLMGHNHKSEEQRLFTDASKVSLKGLLLLTESEFPTEPDSYDKIVEHETFHQLYITLHTLLEYLVRF